MAKPISLTLTFHIQSDWHPGAGREGGAYADNLVVQDAQGLPQLNGKSVKGLLRDACRQAAAYNWVENLSTKEVDTLFGVEGQQQTDQGMIRVESATLSEGEKAWFSANPAAKSHLYRVHFSTAINHATGTAKEGSLRSMEAVVPMVLTSAITIRAQDAAQAEQFAELVEKAATLITAVGGKRRRGFGETRVSVQRNEVA